VATKEGRRRPTCRGTLSGWGSGERDHAVRSVLRMTHNRLVGLGPAGETASLRLLRAVALRYCQDPAG